jgi:hypothetical protein
VTAATIIIARWDDWVLPEDAVCEVITRVGRKHALGLALINQALHDHDGQLELALLAPDGTLTIFSRTERKCRTVRAPLNPREGTYIELEGTHIEPGQHYVRGIVKSTSPATAIPPADRQLPAAGEAGPAARVKESMPEPAPDVELELAPPTERPRVEPTQVESMALPPAPTQVELAALPPGPGSAKCKGGRPPAAWRNKLYRLIDNGQLDPTWSNGDIARHFEGKGNTSPKRKTILNVLAKDKKFLAWRELTKDKREKK